MQSSKLKTFSVIYTVLPSRCRHFWLIDLFLNDGWMCANSLTLKFVAPVEAGILQTFMKASGVEQPQQAFAIVPPKVTLNRGLITQKNWKHLCGSADSAWPLLWQMQRSVQPWQRFAFTELSGLSNENSFDLYTHLLCSGSGEAGTSPSTHWAEGLPVCHKENTHTDWHREIMQTPHKNVSMGIKPGPLIVEATLSCL